MKNEDMMSFIRFLIWFDWYFKIIFNVFTKNSNRLTSGGCEFVILVIPCLSYEDFLS